MNFPRSLLFFVGWFLLMVYAPEAHGQLHRDGEPRSFSLGLAAETIAYELMPPVDVYQLQQEDLVVDTIRDIPWRFGENISVGLNPATSGSWEILANGDRIWRLGIYSPGALSINLTFDHYRLPAGAELYIYNQDRTFVLGAFTEMNNQEDLYFATTLVPGDAVIVEYVEPAGVAFAGELNIETVTHAYRSIFDYSKRFRASGPCHLNVACPEASGWGDEADGVVRIMVGNNSLCTGTLINNANNDGRPYLLTANHCYRNPATLVFWFNWQSETCENPEFAPSYTSMSGAASRARSSVADVWLLELNEPVPLQYNPYFLGWNRTLELKLEETVVSIHHPRGDIKKFSYALGGTAASAYILSPGTGTTYWHVVWSGGTSTEPASSGAPLLDQRGRIIGQLHGGYAACGNEEPDWFGRFGISWSAGQSEGTRLREWLDPYGTDMMQIPGLRPVQDPLHSIADFSATATGQESILLEWLLLNKQHNVLIAVAETESFGQPSGSYSLGDSMTGGGRVIYLGNGEQFAFDGLNPATTYYFKAWTYNAVNNYSEGVVVQATTPAKVISLFTHTESFDGGDLPTSWTVTSSVSQVSWEFGKGNGGSNPAQPYQGNTNAYFYPNQPVYLGQKAMLISPAIDFSQYDKGSVAFYYTNTANASNQDTLRVYYRSHEQTTWVLLATFQENVNAWRKVMLELPALSDHYRIGFEATWQGGFGVCLDELQIMAGYDMVFPAPQNFTAVAAGLDTITLGWEKPALDEGSPQLLGYSISRNGQSAVVIDDPETIEFEDTGLAIGVYTYTITAMYDSPQGSSDSSGPAVAEVVSTGEVFTLIIETAGNGYVLYSGTSQTAVFNQGAIAVLRASAGENAAFRGWYQHGDVITTDSLLFLVMNQDHSVQALFSEKEYLITLSSVPDSLVVLSGAGYVKHGTLHTVSASVPFGWRFLGWREGEEVISTKTSFQFTPTHDISLVAWYEVYNYIETAVSSVAGGVARGSGLYADGEDVVVRAYPNPGWEFIHWLHGDDILSVEPEYSFIASTSLLLTAVFDIPRFDIQAVATHPDIAEISGAGTYGIGETVTLTITYDEAWRFIGWYEEETLLSADDTLSFVVSVSRSILAVLEPKFVGLTLEVEGHGTTIPAPGSYSFEKGASVSLSASPERGWRFKHWLINDEEILNDEFELVLDGPVVARAVFFFVTSASLPETENNGMLVYPNPTEGLVNVLVHHMKGTIRLDVFDMSGHQLLSETRLYILPDNDNGSSTSLDLHGFGPGIYLLRVSDASLVYQTRIVVF